VRSALRQLRPASAAHTGPFLTVEETAAIFRVSGETVRRMVHKGRLAALVLGSGKQAQIRISRRFVERLLADTEAGQTIVVSEAAAQYAETAVA
jgi:excisionase family DNA binding protein